MVTHDVLAIEAASTVGEIARVIAEQVRVTLRRRGAVVGLSGGVDSSVVAALCARALGPDRVLGLLMPERHSSSDSLRLGRLAAEHVGITVLVEELGPTLESVGCYARQAQAIRTVFPGFELSWPFKLTLPSLLEADRLNLFQLTAVDPAGQVHSARLPHAAYLQLVAATNFKQRLRTTLEYYHADRLHYAVAGTPNRLEYDQGFFVKQGDGAADLKPIAHLYKTQVYALAEYLGLPDEIRSRPPTTDTYSLPQTQEEFYFALRYDAMDLCLWAVDHGVPAAEIADALRLAPEQVERVFADVQAKRRAARVLHLPPLMVTANEGA